MMSQNEELENLTQTFAERLRTRRKELSLSQERLAELAGVSPNFLARMELAKRTPSLETLVALAKALAVPVSYLLSVSEETIPAHGPGVVDAALSTLPTEDRSYLEKHFLSLVNHLRRTREQQ